MNIEHRKLMMTIDHQPVTSALTPAMRMGHRIDRPVLKSGDKKKNKCKFLRL